MSHMYRLSLKLISLSLTGLFLSGCNLSTPPNSELLSLEQQALPESLTVAEALPPKGDRVCQSGGMRLVYGLDHDRNGVIGPYESIGMEYLCNASTSDQPGQRVVVIGAGIPAKDRARLLSSAGG